MNERKGWMILAVGVFLFAVFWPGFALAAYLYSSAAAEKIFQ